MVSRINVRLVKEERLTSVAVRDRFVDSFVEFLPEQTLPERRRVELLDEDEEDEDEE